MISKCFKKCGVWLFWIAIALIVAVVVFARFGRTIDMPFCGSPVTTQVYVLAYYPGMDKEELSSAVVKPIEKAFNEMTRILYTQSEFKESGLCLLTLEMFGTHEDYPELLKRVSNRIEGMRLLLPQGAMVKTILDPLAIVEEAEQMMKEFASEFSEKNDL